MLRWAPWALWWLKMRCQSCCSLLLIEVTNVQQHSVSDNAWSKDGACVSRSSRNTMDGLRIEDSSWLRACLPTDPAR